jgi:hypothetical protein
MAYGKVPAAGAPRRERKKQLAWVNFKLERYPVAIKNYEAIGDFGHGRPLLSAQVREVEQGDRAVEL